MKAVEETLGKELRETLTKQQEQWVTIVKNTREEAEESRAQLAKHWESQVDQLEEKLRKNDKEKFELMSKERQHNAIIEQMKKTLNEKEMLLEKLRRDKLVSNENVKQDESVFEIDATKLPFVNCESSPCFTDERFTTDEIKVFKIFDYDENK